MELLRKKCVPCEAETPPLKEEKIKEYLGELKNKWTVLDRKKIRHEFTFKDFRGAMAFVNRIADVAETEGHHPDLYIFYNKVTIELWTHAVGGLSSNDFIMAAKIDQIK